MGKLLLTILALSILVGGGALPTAAFIPSVSNINIPINTPITSTSTSTFYQINNNAIPPIRLHHPLSTSFILSASSPPSENEDDNNDDDTDTTSLASKTRRTLIDLSLAATAAALTYSVMSLGAPALALLKNPEYEQVSPLQFVAALGNPEASSGTGAEQWGLWPTDPGPRGMRLREYAQIQSGDATAPSWLNSQDFFLDENAIIMPPPHFPLPAGKYLVTGARSVTTGLTIDTEGRWQLDEDAGGATLYDVTHLPCRAARYTPAAAGTTGATNGSPSTVRKSDFPVKPGGLMPDVPGTQKQDYAVLFIIGKQKQSV